MKNKLKGGSFIFLGLSLILILISIIFIKDDEKKDIKKQKPMIYTTKEVPKKIATDSPLVIEFIDRFNIDVQIIADTRYLPNTKLSLISEKVIFDENMSFTRIDKITEFNPTVIFLEHENKDIHKYFGKSRKIVDVAINKDKYFDLLKYIWIELGRIFDKEKDAKYDILKLEEYKRLVEEKLHIQGKESITDKVNLYFSNLINDKSQTIANYSGIDVRVIGSDDIYVKNIKRSLDDGLIIGSPISYKKVLEELYKVMSKEDK